MTTATLDRLTDDLVRIDLDLLVNEAELLTRVDRKYVIPDTTLPHLFASLPCDASVLEIDGRRSSAYHSDYLDTPDHRSYLDAGRGRRRRWKVRTRTYADTGAAFLEVKTRGARGATVKERIPNQERENSVWLSDRIGHETVRRLTPTLETAYHRTTLYLPRSGSRATLDSNLAFHAAHGSLRLAGHTVVETKTDGRASEVDRLLWTSGFRPVSLSKYGVGRAALDPRLPRLKWHNVLARLDLPRISYEGVMS